MNETNEAWVGLIQFFVYLPPFFFSFSTAAERKHKSYIPPEERRRGWYRPGPGDGGVQGVGGLPFPASRVAAPHFPPPVFSPPLSSPARMVCHRHLFGTLLYMVLLALASGAVGNDVTFWLDCVQCVCFLLVRDFSLARLQLSFRWTWYRKGGEDYPGTPIKNSPRVCVAMHLT